MSGRATAVERGCGQREAGGIYAECGLELAGLPVTAFLMDPPHRIDPAEHGLSAVGARLVEVANGAHILDWVGSQHYPNVADFVEEAKRFGISRRLPKSLDFARLTAESRLILVHSRAWVANGVDYQIAAQMDEAPMTCPRELAEHHPLPRVTTIAVENLGRGLEIESTATALANCVAVWWHDIEGGEPVADPARPACTVERTMPSFTYWGRHRPDGLVPRYEIAVFATFPIHRVAVVRDEAGGTHVDAAERAAKSGLPVELEDV